MIAIVSGAIANKPGNGGAAWTRLSWALGLKGLGLAVYFIEQIRSADCVDESGCPAPFQESANLRYFRQVTDAFGLAGAAALVCDDGAQTYGLSRRELSDLAGSAGVLVNISGHLKWRVITSRVRRKAFIDLDPGYTQLWQGSRRAGSELGHDLYFTVGVNIGSPGCSIPTGGIHWRPVRQPIVLEHWPFAPSPGCSRFTTVGSWRGAYGAVPNGPTTFGLKVHEFRKFFALPERVPHTFEIALDIHPADARDLVELRRHGWRTVDAKEAAGDPETFRAYVQSSDAEFSAAQGIYVETGSGWFSDRTVRYLASGKPVLVQDTGFGDHFPTGEGLIAFRTLEEAVAGVREIADHYKAHGRAARKLAETYFDSQRVLGAVMAEVEALG